MTELLDLYIVGGARRTSPASAMKAATSNSIGVDRLANPWEDWTSLTYPVPTAGVVTVEMHIADPFLAPGQRVQDFKFDGALLLHGVASTEQGREVVKIVAFQHPGGPLKIDASASVGKTLINDIKASFIPGAVLTPPIVITTPPPVDPGDPTPPTLGEIQDTDSLIAYAGAWQTSTDPNYSPPDHTDHYSSSQGSSATRTFVLGAPGYIEYHGKKAAHHGIANVQIDNGAIVPIDLYNPTDLFDQVLYRSPTLAAGTHTIVISVSGNSNPLSPEKVIELDRFVVANAAPDPTPPVTGGGSGGSLAGYATRSGGTVSVDGHAFKCVGVNLDAWSCWSGESAAAFANGNALVNQTMAMLPPRSLIRVWCQPGCDLSKLDVIVAAAETYGHLLIMCLFNGLTDCSSLSPAPKPAGSNSAELAYIATIVPRYATSKAIGMWELANEPNGSVSYFKAWTHELGAAIKALDTHHMVSAGSHAAWDAGSQAKYIDNNSDSLMDFVSWHSYRDGFVDWGPQAADAGTALSKPYYCGEKGFCCGGPDTGNNDANGALWQSNMLDHIHNGDFGMCYWDIKYANPSTTTIALGSSWAARITAFRDPAMGT